MGSFQPSEHPRLLSAVRGAVQGTTIVRDLAGNIIDPDTPGDFNQALMELGATVCTVRNPSCSTCPISGSCLARKLVTAEKSRRGSSREGAAADDVRGARPCCSCTVCEVGEHGIAALPLAVTDFPRKSAKTAVRDQALSVSVVERNGKNGPQILLVKRPEKGLLAGQWECPCVVLRYGSEQQAADESDTAASKGPAMLEVPEKERHKLADCLLFSSLGLTRDVILSRRSLGSVVHVFSHLRHHMQVEHLRLADTEVHGFVDKEVRWVDVSDMGGVGITTGMKKVLALARDERAKESSSAGHCTRNNN